MKDYKEITIGELENFLLSEEGKAAAKKRFVQARSIVSIVKNLAKQVPDANDDTVKITCYRDTEITTRSKAIAKYRDGIDHSDGAERGRYYYIVDQLQRGAKVIDADA